MTSLLEYKLRKSLDSKLKQGAVSVDPAILELVITSALKIVENLADRERLLRLQEYQRAKEAERGMILSIIEAKENLGEPYYVTLKEIKNYLALFKKKKIQEYD